MKNGGLYKPMSTECSAFNLPESPFLSQTTREVLRQQLIDMQEFTNNRQADGEVDTEAWRPSDAQREQYCQSDAYRLTRERNLVEILTEEIGGVVTERGCNTFCVTASK